MYDKDGCKNLSLESLAVHIYHYNCKLKISSWQGYFEMTCLTEYISRCKEFFIWKFSDKYENFARVEAVEFIDYWLDGTYNGFPHL